MSERAELERRLVEAAIDYGNTELRLNELITSDSFDDLLLESHRKQDKLHRLSIALADALRDEQRVGGRPWGGE